ncbi:MAG TPA: Vms1/Ankzf1 family peptidyl-tRNA hydrolase, partial [Actinomycetes bacterium]|nr:Vms1/Ankzf1 family peptidyl-tRNA hydrolase [Actinomycetes bacterium]
AMAGLSDDRRLRPLFDLATERFLTVPEPRLVVLADTPRLFRAVRIELAEPDEPAAGGAR